MSRVSERCREIQRAIQAGKPFSDFAEELDRMEEWLRENGKWRDENQGWSCPWVDHCRCTHKGCGDGWLLADVPGRTVKGNESQLVALRCPQCDRARLLVEHSRKASKSRR